MKIPQNIADSLLIRCMFYNKIHFSPAQTYGWVTQPFPVLVMFIKGKGETAIAHGTETVMIREQLKPFFLPSYMMRKPIVTDDTGFDLLALGFVAEVLGGIGLLNFYDVPIIYSGKDEERIRDLMIELFDLGPVAEVQDLNRLAEQKKLMFDMFGILVKNAAQKKEGLLLNSEEYGCLPAVSYLKEHFSSPFDLEKLLDMCHFSQAHFFRLFRKLTGVSPKNYQKDRRIEHAQRLLLTTSHSVAEIGERVGWNDQFHFSRIFKARTGFSPRQYRQHYRLNEF